MYRRGAFEVLALLLVVLVGSAVAQQLSGSQLVVSGEGPHAIGAGTNPNVQLLIAGLFPGRSSPQGVNLGTVLSPNAGTNAHGMYLNPEIVEAASGNHAHEAALYVSPVIKNGGATATNAEGIYVDGFVAAPGTTNASGIYVANAPVGATNNHALWVASGSTLLGGMLRVTGDAQIDGNISAKYQDLAEWVPSASALADGTVTIIDSRAPNRVVMSQRPYDTHVAGVVSSRPGILLGEGGSDKTKVAHSGRVKVKVDAGYGPIAIGDLLVTSATPGYAMRSEPMRIGVAEMHRPGTIMGKALESLSAGRGEILVLLTLQ